MTKRLLFVDTSPVFGGAQRSLLDFIRSLDPVEHQSFVLSADPSDDGLGGKARQLGLTEGFLPVRCWERDLPGYAAFFTDLMRARKWLPMWVANCGVDLVYANGIRSALLASLVLPPEIPLIFHHRDYYCPDRILRFVTKRAQATVVVSDFLRQRTLEVIGQEQAAKVHRVYNGFQLAEIRKKAGEFDFPEHFRWGEQPAMVAMVGDFVRWKRHDLFLRAVAIAARREPKLVGFVLGGARDQAGFDYGQNLHHLAEQLGILPRLAFTDHADKPYALMQACKVMVSVAENEPFGRSVVESLALGKPLVITPGGGPAEITQGCLAVQTVAAEPEAIAEGILKGLHAPPTWTDAALAQAELYAAQRHHPQLLAIVNQVLSHAPASPGASP